MLSFSFVRHTARRAVAGPWHHVDHRRSGTPLLSPLADRLTVVRDELKLPIGVLCPHDNPDTGLK